MRRSTPAPRGAQRNCTLKAPCSWFPARRLARLPVADLHQRSHVLDAGPRRVEQPLRLDHTHDDVRVARAPCGPRFLSQPFVLVVVLGEADCDVAGDEHAAQDGDLGHGGSGFASAAAARPLVRVRGGGAAAVAPAAAARLLVSRPRRRRGCSPLEGARLV